MFVLSFFILFSLVEFCFPFSCNSSSLLICFLKIFQRVARGNQLLGVSYLRDFLLSKTDVDHKGLKNNKKLDHKSLKNNKKHVRTFSSLRLQHVKARDPLGNNSLELLLTVSLHWPVLPLVCVSWSCICSTVVFNFLCRPRQ